MGAWSAGISGSDTAMDLRSEYQAAFYSFDVETALKKIDAYVRSEGFDESDPAEWCDYYYSLADFMWKKGILTEEVKQNALRMIDGEFGLDLWAESGKSILNKRKKALAAFREKLLSPQPPKKKIKIDLYMTPIFEAGDVIALQLKTNDKYYMGINSGFTEEYFRSCHDHWVVMRKAYDEVSYVSGIVSEVRDIWPHFQLYRKMFDQCPRMEDIAQGTWVRLKDGRACVYVTEGSMRNFTRRNARVIGRSLDGMENARRQPFEDSIYLGTNTSFAGNGETDILKALRRE